MIQTVKQRVVIGIMIVFGVLPWILVTVAGFIWLWQEQWLLAWLGVALATGFLSWLAARQFRAQVARPPVPNELQAKPSDHWSVTQREAWENIERICR